MRKMFAFLLVAVLLCSYSLPAVAAEDVRLAAAINNTADFLLQAVITPQVDSVGGEWAVIGLARSGLEVSEAFFKSYYEAVESLVSERGAVLDPRRFTENSRVILALSASGYNPLDVAGFDLTLPLGDYERVVGQGINGPIWALIALDSRSYPIPINPNASVQATREMYLSEILRRQTPDGGWNLTAGAGGSISAGERGDPGITGMALQALSNYQENTNVKAAVDRALSFLTDSQNEDGGFTSGLSGNASDVESAVQVIVALGALGVSIDDSRFMKNGNTIVDNVLSHGLADGSFRHARNSRQSNQMSTEQAFYGLVAAHRAQSGQNSLYAMDDAPLRADLHGPLGAVQIINEVLLELYRRIAAIRLAVE